MPSLPGRRRAALAEARGRRRRAALFVACAEMVLVSSFLFTLSKDLLNNEGGLYKTKALMVSCAIHLVLALLLLHAVRENDLRKIWAWVGVRAVVWVTDLLMSMVEAVSEDERQGYAVCFLVFCLLSVGNIWIVWKSAIGVCVIADDLEEALRTKSHVTNKFRASHGNTVF